MVTQVTMQYPHLSMVSSLCSCGAPSPKTNFFILSKIRSVLLTSVLRYSFKTGCVTRFSVASLHNIVEVTDAMLVCAIYPSCNSLTQCARARRATRACFSKGETSISKPAPTPPPPLLQTYYFTIFQLLEFKQSKSINT